MSKKKLLSEAQVRRFMGLAGIQPLNEMGDHKEDLYEEEEEELDIEAEEEAELPAPEEEVEAEMEVTDEVPEEETEMDADSLLESRTNWSLYLVNSNLFSQQLVKKKVKVLKAKKRWAEKKWLMTKAM